MESGLQATGACAATLSPAKYQQPRNVHKASLPVNEETYSWIRHRRQVLP